VAKDASEASVRQLAAAMVQGQTGEIHEMQAIAARLG
jgi:hypothetical protein